MNNNSGIVLMFPVEPHVYKFLQHKCGERLEASKHDLYGNIVLDILSKKYTVGSKIPEGLNYPVEISLRYMENAGIYVDKNVIRKFNHRMDKIFREEMRTFVRISAGRYHIAKEKALREFLNDYNICEDDIKFETLVKDIGRNVMVDK